MTRKSRGTLALDLLMWAVVASALALLAHERVMPWLADRAIIDPGDPVDDGLALLDAGTGDTIGPVPGSPTLLFVFQSTCDACERAVPTWARLAREVGQAAIAVGLEPAEDALRYARSRFASARPAVPADPARFTRLFRVQVVPTTLLIDREGRLAARHAGPLEDSEFMELRRRLAASVP